MISKENASYDIEHNLYKLKNLRDSLSDVSIQDNLEYYFQLITLDSNIACQFYEWGIRLDKIPSLIREFLKYARLLSDYEKFIAPIYKLMQNNSKLISSNKRLYLEFCEFELNIREKCYSSSSLSN